MGLRGPMLRRSTDPISALTGCHAPARGAGRTAHAPGSLTPPLGPLGPQERAGDRRGARRAPPAEPPEALSPPLAGFPRARPRPRPPTPRPRAPDAPPSFSFFSMAVRACLSTGRRRGRGEGRRRPQLRRRRSAGSDRVSGVEGGGAKRVWCATATTLATALAAALATLCRLASAAGGGGSGLLG